MGQVWCRFERGGHNDLRSMKGTRFFGTFFSGDNPCLLQLPNHFNFEAESNPLTQSSDQPSYAAPGSRPSSGWCVWLRRIRNKRPLRVGERYARLNILLFL